jgi:protein gp37
VPRRERTAVNRSGIEWTEFSANPVKGRCPHFGTARCGTYCYAEDIRLRQGTPEKLAFHPDVVEDIQRRRKGGTIFLGSMIDLWADAMPPDWLRLLVNLMWECKHHTFLLCTKNPRRYLGFTFPANVWLGVTDTGNGALEPYAFEPRQNYFASCEPLVGRGKTALMRSKTVVVGVGSFRSRKKAQVESRKHPGTEVVRGARGEWLMRPEEAVVWEVIEEAAYYKLPIFLKDNLHRAFPGRFPKALRVLPWRT